MPPSAAAEVAHVAKIGGAGLTGIGVLDAVLEPAGGIRGVIGWLTDAGEAVGIFGRVLQPFRELAATLAGNGPLMLIIAGATIRAAGIIVIHRGVVRTHGFFRVVVHRTLPRR